MDCKNLLSVPAVSGTSTFDNNTCLTRRASSTSSPIWLTTCQIQIVFDDFKHKAISDSQASACLMTRAFAQDRGFSVVQKFESFQMIDGTTEFSMGLTLVQCGIEGDPASVGYRQFHVFERLYTPVLIGRSFWDDDQSCHSPSAVHVQYAVQYPCIPLTIQRKGTSGKTVMSVVDTGAISNLMSLKFARRESLPLKSPTSRQIMASNGRPVSVAGTVKVKIQLGAFRGSHLYCVFLVIAGLPYDAGLGRKFLFNQKHRAAILSSMIYVTRTGHFVFHELEREDLTTIGNAFVDRRVKDTDPGDTPEVKEGKKKLSEIKSKLKPVSDIVRQTWKELEAVTTQAQRDALRRELEKEIRDEVSNPNGKFKRWFHNVGGGRNNDVKERWKKFAKQERELETLEKQVEVDVGQMEKESRRRKKSLQIHPKILTKNRAGDWRYKSEDPDSNDDRPDNHFLAVRKQLALSEKRRRQLNLSRDDIDMPRDSENLDY